MLCDFDKIFDGEFKKRPCAYFLDNKGTMTMLKRLCKEFYRLPECGAGGPLHILLDDDNYDSGSIMFCLRECLNHPNDSVRTLGIIICKEYLRMNMVERAVFDSYWCGQKLDCCVDCQACDLLVNDHHEYMCEAEEEENEKNLI
jgi:hypothetical protein